MFTPLIVASLVYLIGFPLGFTLVGIADKQYKNWHLNKQLMKRGANKIQLTRNAPEPLMPKWRGRLKYARGDKRNLVLPAKLDKNGKPAQLKDGSTSQPKPTKFSRRGMYWFIRAIGFALALTGGLIGSFAGWKPTAILIALALVPYIWSLVWGYQSADKILTIREKLLKKMFSTARTKLGQSAEFEANPGEVVRVIEWEEEIKPQKVEFDIPDTFGEEGMEAFMKHFNQNFGRETAWVPSDDPETGEPGWDFEKGLLTINAVPPLPTMAPWSEHYVLGEGVAWSFFPIALGVENGLELPNPKTGEVENVLGFDLSGEQAGAAKQFGLKMSQSITTSPMCLTPDTLILTSEGPKRIDVLAEAGRATVMSYNIDSGIFEESTMFGIQKTRVNSPIVSIRFTDGSEVRSTPDHKLLSDTNEYIAAEEMAPGQRIRGFGSDTEFREVESVTDAGFSDVFDGEVFENHNFVIITDEEKLIGLVSKNCLVAGGTGGGKALSCDTMVRVINHRVPEDEYYEDNRSKENVLR